MFNASIVQGLSNDQAKAALKEVRVAKSPLSGDPSKYFQYSVVLYLSHLSPTQKFYLEDGTDQDCPIEIPSEAMIPALADMGLEKEALMVSEVVCLFEKKPTYQDPVLLWLAPYTPSMDELIDGGPTAAILSQTPADSLGSIKANNWF